MIRSGGILGELIGAIPGTMILTEKEVLKKVYHLH